MAAKPSPPPPVSNQFPPDKSTINFPAFHQQDIDKAIARLAPFKAPGPSGIPNIAIKSASSFLSPILLTILDSSLSLGYFPRRWRQYSTVTLRKPGKRDYTQAKAYRPIALEEALGKVAESVMARWLSELAEAHDLLPNMHFGGRPGRTTSDALLTLVQAIKDAWRKGHVATMLAMDIRQAFPSVSHWKLREEMSHIGLPPKLVNWVQSFLHDRTTTLSFDDYISEPRGVNRGLPQGSPLSPILYLIYSAGLLTLSTSRSEPTVGFIDDTCKLVTSLSVEDNLAKLRHFAPLAASWSDAHDLAYDFSKYQLIHFTQNKSKQSDEGLVINGTTIPASPAVKYLGAWLDRRLDFKAHTEYAMGRCVAPQSPAFAHAPTRRGSRQLSS